MLDGLKEKAKLVTELLNKIEGVKCNPVQGAMYAFPKIDIPQKAVEYAKVYRWVTNVYKSTRVVWYTFLFY